jgi:LSD1 subclass zinc finger protein
MTYIVILSPYFVVLRMKFLCTVTANQVAHVNCGNCRMLLMYQYGARSVKCAVCNFVTSVGVSIIYFLFLILIYMHNTSIVKPWLHGEKFAKRVHVIMVYNLSCSVIEQHRHLTLKWMKREIMWCKKWFILIMLMNDDAGLSKHYWAAEIQHLIDHILYNSKGHYRPYKP